MLTPLYTAKNEGKFASYLAHINVTTAGQPAIAINVLGFRGTTNTDEMTADLQTNQTSCSVIGISEPCGVHKGFAKGFLDLRDEVATGLAAHLEKYPASELRIVGHSLGGALATLFAQDVARNYTLGPNPKIPNLSLYTVRFVGRFVSHPANSNLIL